MANETSGANDKAAAVASTANDKSEPQASVERVQALHTENESLKKTQRSLQREVERWRRQGMDTRNLEARFQTNEAALTYLTETIGKLAKAAELEGADPAPILEKIRSRKPVDNEPPEAQKKAGVAIVTLAAGAGIGADDFDETWQSDERLAAARTYWSLGQFDAATEATRQALAGGRKTKTYTEEELQEAVKKAALDQRRDSASAPPNKSVATGNERTITAADIAKMTPEQRSAIAKDIRAALRK